MFFLAQSSSVERQLGGWGFSWGHSEHATDFLALLLKDLHGLTCKIGSGSTTKQINSFCPRLLLWMGLRAKLSGPGMFRKSTGYPIPTQGALDISGPCSFRSRSVQIYHRFLVFGAAQVWPLEQLPPFCCCGISTAPLCTTRSQAT